ncbi:hypothetical protein J2S43_001413 [Catenuloplanes nepalensis]|uniref:Fibronectin type III domain protein n=1 Tax=Catenuloplanes nepalensis TaxID=587533 RepID=A0ABT9MNJ3_9ACTN|nr:discoidin domain-containing protein [Catenuloplanes nepalensis]MDP9792901.1 hypothetical protein [Catenuloplanes nepalensis]
MKRSRTVLAVVLAAAGVAGAGAVILPTFAGTVAPGLTGDGGTVTAQHPGGSAAEDIGKLIDGDEATKYLTHSRTGWVQYEATAAAVVDRYALTSANDAPDRDPRDWTLAGSADGTAWTTLDTRSGETFGARAATRGFLVSGTPAAYRFYRLTVTANNGSPALQMAEWRLWPAGDGIPAAPSGLTAAAVGTGEIDLAWTDNSDAATGYPEAGFAVDSSGDGQAWTTIGTVPAGTTIYTDRTPLTGGTRSYRVRALGAATGVTSPPSEPATVTAVRTGVDITDMDGTVTDQYATTGAEDANRAADNAPGTKYLTGRRTTWLQHTAKVRSTVTEYTVTSADDAPDRDPRDWVLEGSADGTAWTTLDTRTGQAFGARFQRRTYPIANPAGFLAYRLRITANNGSPAVQVGEWQLIGSSTTPAPAPAVPAGLRAVARTGDQVVISWTDADRWETGFRLERSADGRTWDWSRTVPAGTTTAHDFGRTGETTYHYRVRAVNATTVSAPGATATATTGSGELPVTWQEHWLEHSQPLTRVAYDADVAVYFDPDVPASQAGWLQEYTGTLWRYTRRTYGDFSNPRLAAIFHQGRYGGGHPATVFDADHDHRNVIDIGLSSWNATDPQARDITSHEIAHIVEGSANGVHGSPSFGLWGDSKWAEIFQYDVYAGTGLTADAARWHAAKLQTRDSFPRAGTAWYRDWFYPLWRDHGGSAVLDGYFDLLAANFPQVNGEYARDLNWGEFVHFWSGAAGVNLKAQATAAFGWPDEWEQQFVQAQREFPDVRY